MAALPTPTMTALMAGGKPRSAPLRQHPLPHRTPLSSASSSSSDTVNASSTTDLISASAVVARLRAQAHAQATRQAAHARHVPSTPSAAGLSPNSNKANNANPKANPTSPLSPLSSLPSRSAPIDIYSSSMAPVWPGGAREAALPGHLDSAFFSAATPDADCVAAAADLELSYGSLNGKTSSSSSTTRLPFASATHDAMALSAAGATSRSLGMSPLARRGFGSGMHVPSAGPRVSSTSTTSGFSASTSLGNSSAGSSVDSSGSLSSLRRGLRAARATRPPPPALAARRLSLEEAGTPQRAMVTISEDTAIEYSGCDTEDPAVLSLLRAKAHSAVAVPPKNDWLVQDLLAALTDLRSEHLDNDASLSVPMRALLDGRLEKDLRDLGLPSALSLLASPRSTTARDGLSAPESDAEDGGFLDAVDVHDVDDDDDDSCRGEAFVPDAVMSFLEHFLPARDLARLRRAVDAQQGLGSNGDSDTDLADERRAAPVAGGSPGDGINADLLTSKLQALAAGSMTPDAHSGAGEADGSTLDLAAAFASAGMLSGGGGNGQRDDEKSSDLNDGAILLPLSSTNPYDLDEDFLPRTPRG